LRRAALPAARLPGRFSGNRRRGRTGAEPGCGATATLQSGTITLGSRNYILNVPADYDSDHPYRLILGFHGANGRASDVAGDYFGLLPLSAGSTIFVAANADGGLWSAATDVAYVDQILEQVTAALCIDTSRIMMEASARARPWRGPSRARARTCIARW
jgi:poly(3-hydroxybutyrate) depolymerase